MHEFHPHEWMILSPPVDPYLYETIILSSGAALALAVWDILITLDDEVVHIWSRPGWTHVKLIYFFSRWYGLVNQIGIQIFHGFFARFYPIPMKTCQVYIIFETTSFQLLQLCLDLILFLRIRAVYQQRRRSIAIASIVIFLETLTALVIYIISVPKAIVDGNCILLETPTTTTIVGIAMMSSQSILLYLTYRGKILMRPAVRRSKIVTVVLRDGFLVFGVVVGIVLISCIYFLFNHTVLNVFLPWLSLAPSLLTARIILNMQTAVDTTDSSIEFTTELDIMVGDDVAQATRVYEADVIHGEPRNPSPELA